MLKQINKHWNTTNQRKEEKNTNTNTQNTLIHKPPLTYQQILLPSTSHLTICTQDYHTRTQLIHPPTSNLVLIHFEPDSSWPYTLKLPPPCPQNLLLACFNRFLNQLVPHTILRLHIHRARGERKRGRERQKRIRPKQRRIEMRSKEREKRKTVMDLRKRKWRGTE